MDACQSEKGWRQLCLVQHEVGGETLPARLPQSVPCKCPPTRVHSVPPQHVETGLSSTHYSTNPSQTPIQQPPMRLQ